MRLYLLLLALPVLGLPGPKHKRSSTPAPWWSPSISPSNSPIRSGTIEWSSTPQYSPTPHPSSSVPIPSSPPSSTTSHSPSSRPLSTNESSNPTWSGQLRPSSSTVTDSKPTRSRSLSPGAAPEWTYSKTQTSDENEESATRSYTFSAYGETGTQTYSETGTTAFMVTPDPSTVTISETETVEDVEENTVYKTEKDGHETSIPILFGKGCLTFCNTGALLLWGIGPEDGKFELPPIPGISPLPKIIDIKGGIPTPEGTQGSDSEPTESMISQTEESSDASTSESTTTEATTTESTSTCTRATITNCGITTDCGPKTCSTITSCEPTVTDCTATGTTVSTTASQKYELAMDAYTGRSLVTPSPSSTFSSKPPSYDLTMAVYSGGSLAATPSRSSTPYELTMAVYSSHSLATSFPSSTPASSTPLYQLSMAIYTGHNPTKSSTFRTYQITTTMTVGDSPKRTKTTKTKSSPSKVTKISPPTEKASCYPKLGDTKEDKVLEIKNSRLNNFCGDPTRVLHKKLRDPPRVDYIEAGWSLDDDAPEPCSDLPTTEGKSGGYRVCTLALSSISRACPWNGGTIRTECGEFRLRGCIGPCNN